MNSDPITRWDAEFERDLRAAKANLTNLNKRQTELVQLQTLFETAEADIDEVSILFM